MSTPCVTATKLTLVLINFLFVGVGIAAMVIGGWVLLYREEVRALTMIDVATKEMGLLQNAAILTATSGLALFVLGFVGCCATYKQQRCLQAVYIGVVVLCLLVTICACAVAFFFRDEMEDDLLDFLETKLKTEYEGFSKSTVDFSQAWDYAQVEFRCCGIRGQDDFRQAMNWTVRDSAIVPVSCCVLTDRDAFLEDNFYTVADINCPQFPDANNSYVDNPCYGELKDWMEEEVMMIGAVTIAAMVLQVLAVVFIIGLMRHIPKQSSSILYRDSASSTY